VACGRSQAFIAALLWLSRADDGWDLWDGARSGSGGKIGALFFANPKHVQSKLKHLWQTSSTSTLAQLLVLLLAWLPSNHDVDPEDRRRYRRSNSIDGGH